MSRDCDSRTLFWNFFLNKNMKTAYVHQMLAVTPSKSYSFVFTIEI